MSDIFEEVDESLRQDKIETAWKRYRPFVYGGAVLLIGSVALNEFVLRPAAEKARDARALEFETSETQLAEGDYAEAQAGFREIVDGESSLAPLAANFVYDLTKSYEIVIWTAIPVLLVGSVFYALLGRYPEFDTGPVAALSKTGEPDAVPSRT